MPASGGILRLEGNHRAAKMPHTFHILSTLTAFQHCDLCHPCWAGQVCSEILVIYLYLLAPDPSHLSRRDKTCSVSKSSHLSRYDMTFGPTGDFFLSARCARGQKAHFGDFIHPNFTTPSQKRRNYHKSGQNFRILFCRTTKISQLGKSYVTYLLGPQISSHLSRHDMTCLSGPQISSHLSQFVFDMTPPEIESFVEKIVATNLPRARERLRDYMASMTRHEA